MEVEMEFCTCPVCGVGYAMPKRLRETRRVDKGAFYCPNGHQLSFRESETDKLRRECNSLKQQQARYEQWLQDLREETDAERRRSAAYRGQVTRLRKRASAGVCPCCSRHFTNLERHMKTKHPEAVDAAVPGDELKVIEGGKS